MIIGAHTKLAAVIGHPVEHSRSPALHNAAYRALGLDAVYLAFQVVPGAVVAALDGARALGFLGLNVTVPHKRTAFELCDDLDDSARQVGVVNTVVVHGGRLRGHNTDIEGFGASLDTALDRRPSRAVVLGAGGAARAVLAALGHRGIVPCVIARDVERAQGLGATDIRPWTAAALDDATAGAELLIDSTSAALSGEAEAQVPAPVPLDRMAPSALVMSLVYHRQPELLQRARARGLRALDGAGMLVHQAALAFTLMTGREAPLDAMWGAFQEIARTAET